MTISLHSKKWILDLGDILQCSNVQKNAKKSLCLLISFITL